MTTFHTELPQWTEGVCGDGAAILRDGVMIPIEEVIARLNQAEAALAAPEQGPTDEELYQFWFDHDLWDDDIGPGDVAAIARAALARWGRPAVEPVPVSERLPGPEDTTDRNECWYWHPGEECWEMVPVVTCTLDEWTHWLPHWALPVPQEGSDG